MTANLLSTLDRATPDDIVHGASWYTDAHALATSLGDITVTAAVIAALSPQLSWVINQRLAIKACNEGSLSGGALGLSVAKVNRILSGETPLDVLGGDKVRSFYDNILYPHGESVTIDRHAYDAANGMSTKSTLGRKGEYERYADMYRTAAARVGIAAPTLQAIIWVVWRREKGLTWAG